MSNVSHYFIAIPLPENVQHYFSSCQRALKKKLKYKQWPHQQDLHITLKFLGPVDDNKIEQLHQALLKVTSIQTFPIDVGSIGTFGKVDMPRVLWGGVTKTPKLAALQQQIEIKLVQLGFQKETRTYRPHITLAKKWDGEAADLLENIKQDHKAQQQIIVDTIVLYKIHPTSIPKYEPVFTYSLQGGE